MDSLLTASALIFGGLGAVCFVFLFGGLMARKPLIGFVVLSLMIVSNWHLPIWPGMVSLAGLSITVPDVLAVLFMASFIARAGTLGRRLSTFERLFLILAVVIILSVLVGTAYNGLGTAVNEARPWLFSIAAGAWLLSFAGQFRDSLTSAVENFLLWSAGGVCVIAVFNIVLYGLGNASSGVLDQYGITSVGGRPITAAQAVLLPLALFVCVRRLQYSRKIGYVLLACLLLVMVVVTQHRTVWAASASGILVVITCLRSSGRSAAIFGALATFVTAWLVLSNSLFSSLSQNLTSSAGDSRTYDGRVYDWIVEIQDSIQSGIVTVLLGTPFGAGWDRFREDGLLITYTPHNWYVVLYLRVGIIGLMILAVVLGASFWRGIRSNQETRLMYLPIAVTLGVYSWTYNMQWYLVPVFLWALLGLWSRNFTDSNSKELSSGSGVKGSSLSPQFR